jgi:citrate synthase
MSEPPAVLRYDENEVELPIVRGTENEPAVDISKLRSQTGFVTLDYGFVNTGSCESAITYIDGDAGILRYRGIPIEQLVERDHPSFLETCYLLLWGDLPTQKQLDDFRYEVRRHTLIKEDVKRFYDGFPKDAHPMAILSSVVSALSTFYQDSDDIHDEEQVHLSIVRLIAKLPTIASYAYKKSIGQPFLYPNNELDLIENFLTMMFAVPSERYEVSPTVVHALKQLLILHADHEQNCSTSTVRLVGSSQANLYAAVSAGILALWGPLHGGANQAVIEMLQHIESDGRNYRKYVEMAKDKSSGFRLMGFGHRVYKNFDPRAKILKGSCDRVLEHLGISDPLLEIAKSLEDVALRDDFFVERKLYPNVDFYSGILYRAMGIPTDMFTVMFALGRLPGWIAHWKEMTEDPVTRINRPRQIYTGATQRSFVPISER